jgi:hypothetical protein
VSQASAVATAATFVWLGMALAISFLEAPVDESEGHGERSCWPHQR